MGGSIMNRWAKRKVTNALNRRNTRQQASQTSMLSTEGHRTLQVIPITWSIFGCFSGDSIHSKLCKLPRRATVEIRFGMANLNMPAAEAGVSGSSQTWICQVRVIGEQPIPSAEPYCDPLSAPSSPLAKSPSDPSPDRSSTPVANKDGLWLTRLSAVCLSVLEFLDEYDVRRRQCVEPNIFG